MAVIVLIQKHVFQDYFETQYLLLERSGAYFRNYACVPPIGLLEYFVIKSREGTVEPLIVATLGDPA